MTETIEKRDDLNCIQFIYRWQIEGKPHQFVAYSSATADTMEEWRQRARAQAQEAFTKSAAKLEAQAQ